MYLVIVKDPELQYLPLTLLERPLSKVYVMIMLGYNLDLSRGEFKTVKILKILYICITYVRGALGNKPNCMKYQNIVKDTG
jgi:hypothetical protein